MLIGYPLIITLAVCGSLGAPWWLALLGAIGLTSIAVWPRRRLAARLGEIGQGELFAIATAYSFFSSLIVSILSISLGRLAILLV